MNKSDKKVGPKNIKKYKSLKNRIRFLVNLSIVLSVFLVCALLIGFANIAIQEASTNTSLTIIEEVQEQIENLVIEAETKGLGSVTTDHLVELYQRNGVYKRNISRQVDQLPIFSTSIIIGDTEIYQMDADEIVGNILLDIKNQDVEDIEIHVDEFELSGTSIEDNLYDFNGNIIGSITVGIDTRIEMAVYIALIASVSIVGIIVILIMQFIINLFVKPILKPLEKLQTQLEHLADESYEDINPSIIVDKRAVREVRELSDVTNKLLNKMVNYNEVITQSEKMASVGQLTAAITHEINTPLGVINANAGLMKMLAEEAVKTSDGDAKEMLLETMGDTAETTEEACSRIQEIIKSLRSYSRIDQADFMPASINESMKSVVTLTTNLHKNRIQIIEEFGVLPDVSCYIGLINQVFMNLIINAIQAIEGEGIITLRTTNDEKYIYASVIDSGCGIGKKNIYRVFEYGFTTKQPGSGSGIGLALSKNIVHKHNGEIIIDSVEGEGSTITVKLPINH